MISIETCRKAQAGAPHLDIERVRRIAEILLPEVVANVRACERKKKFDNAAAADAAAGSWQRVYRCAVCKQWHLTKKKAK